MTIIFTDSYKGECERKFGIKRDNVIETYTYPDKDQVLVTQGLKIYLYLKKFQEFYLLVYEVKKGINANLEIDCAFKFTEDFVTKVSTSEPLELLAALATNFGLVVKVGGRKSKFVYNEVIPTVVNDPTRDDVNYCIVWATGHLYQWITTELWNYHL
jgi:hypothetical protein